MKLTNTSSYNCTQIFYTPDQKKPDEEFVTLIKGKAILKPTLKTTELENRSLTSSSSSTASSYSSSASSEFCSSSPDCDTPEDLCRKFNQIDLSEPNKSASQSTPINIKRTCSRRQSERNAVELSNYTKVEKIRSGGFGEVFAGVRRSDSQPIAIKKIRKDKISLWNDVSRFTFIFSS